MLDWMNTAQCVDAQLQEKHLHFHQIVELLVVIQILNVNVIKKTQKNTIQNTTL